MAVQFTPLAIKDIESVIKLMQEFYAIDNYPMDPELSKQLFHTFLENENLGRAWLIKQNGQTAGYVILTFVFSFEYGGRIAFLDELFILPEVQGYGLGKQALDFIDVQSVLLDVKLIYLEVEQHNTIAQNLYTSKNYTLHKRNIMKHVPGQY